MVESKDFEGVEEKVILCNDQVQDQKNNVKIKNIEKQAHYERSREIDEILKNMPIADETICGLWCFKGSFFQRFANQNAFVILYGLAGCIFSMTFAYFNGSLTTIEKRFKIPSKNMGIITVGYDLSQLLIAGVLSYYAGKGHRPRWIGFGVFTIASFPLLMMITHYIYGAGKDALSLTTEYGGVNDLNLTNKILAAHQTKSLCRLSDNGKCVEESGSLIPQIILFLAQFIAGVGGSLFASLGISYMDDNAEKSKTPALLSLAYFVRMLGPAAGYALASFCLSFYIAPQLTPTITNEDPRWLGAWWMGWLFFAAINLFFSIILTMFPKQLPCAAAKLLIEKERKQQNNDKNYTKVELGVDDQPSFEDMLKTFKELASNKTFMYNNWSSVFYFLGYTPYWIFTPKYIEIQYLKTAATSNMVTGSIALAFSAAGVLLSGFVISRYKPCARAMAAWNVLVGLLTIFGIVAYAFIGCTVNEKSIVVNIYDGHLQNNATTCNSACNCAYVQYSPVCGENNLTCISPCHAGCKRQKVKANGQKDFFDCTCINRKSFNDSIDKLDLNGLSPLEHVEGGFAFTGACPVNCFARFVSFIAIMCCLKFLGAAGRA